jgi:hypothetical protein
MHVVCISQMRNILLYRVLVWIHEGKNQWSDNIKTDRKDAGCIVLDSLHLGRVGTNNQRL